MSEELSAAELARQMLLNEAASRAESADDATEQPNDTDCVHVDELPGLGSDEIEQAVEEATGEQLNTASDSKADFPAADAQPNGREDQSSDGPAAALPVAGSQPPAQTTVDVSDRIYDLANQRDEALAAASEAVRAGGCIVLPTDTVYGIGANAFNPRAVQALLDAKQRGRDMPPPVLIAEPELLPALVAEVSESAQSLVINFWPGALTLIFNAQSGMQLDLGETGGTIAVRVPDHELTRDLLRATGPLAVSSANLTGQPAATDVQAAADQLGETVRVYLDGGATPGNVPSTIVDFSQTNTGQIVRHGVLSFDELRERAPFLTDIPDAEG